MASQTSSWCWHETLVVQQVVSTWLGRDTPLGSWPAADTALVDFDDDFFPPPDTGFVGDTPGVEVSSGLAETLHRSSCGHRTAGLVWLAETLHHREAWILASGDSCGYHTVGSSHSGDTPSCSLRVTCQAGDTRRLTVSDFERTPSCSQCSRILHALFWKT